MLRSAFSEAQRRGVAVRVVIAGSPAAAGSDVFLFDLVERWAEKYPGVSVATSVRRGVDAAVVLSAATRGCGLAVMPQPADTNTAAVLQALSRRAHCPLVLVGETTGGHNQSSTPIGPELPTGTGNRLPGRIYLDVAA